METLSTATIYGIDLPATLLDRLDEDRQDGIFVADAWTAASPPGDLLATTRTTYARVLARTPVERLPYVDDPRVLSVVRRHVRARIRDDAAAVRAAYDAGDWDRLAAAVDALRAGVRALTDVGPKTVSLGPEAAKKPRRRARGKGRVKLAGLPKDWDIRVLRAAPHADRPWIAALALSGARPGVLQEPGIHVRVAGDQLLVTVPGSKGGPGWVVLTFARDANPVADAMAAYVNSHGGAVHLRMGYDRAKKRHERITRHALGRPLPLSAHRHQVHADLRAAEVDRATIARATGKTSEAGITVYATAARGRSTRGLALQQARVMAHNPAPGPRQTPDTPAPAAAAPADEPSCDGPAPPRP
jgi:hypothetical protein